MMLRKLSPFVFAIAALGTALVAQDPKKPAVPDKEVAAKLKELTGCVKDRKMTRDAEGIEIIDVLWKKLEQGAIDKDRSAITKGLGKVLTSGKVRLPDNIGLYSAAVMTLGYCGEDGAKVLEKAYESKRFPHKKPWVPLREKMLRAVGKTKAEDMVKFLVDEARRNPEDALMAAAGEALGNFENSEEAVRKDIVSGLLRRWGELAELASQLGSGNIQAANARNTLAAISGKWNESLAKLTRQNFTKFIDWQNWNNKNRSKPWK